MTKSKRSAAVAVGLLVLLGTVATRAEVSVNPVDSQVHFLVMEEVPFGSFTEDPDPVGIVWIPMRNISQDWLLNSDGGPRGDRRPDSVRLPGGNAPAAVWAYVPGPLNVSVHYEEGDLWLAWRQDTYEFDHVVWTGSGWSAPVAHFWDNYTWMGREQIRHLIRWQVRLP